MFKRQLQNWAEVCSFIVTGRKPYLRSFIKYIFFLFLLPVHFLFIFPSPVASRLLVAGFPAPHTSLPLCPLHPDMVSRPGPFIMSLSCLSMCQPWSLYLSSPFCVLLTSVWLQWLNGVLRHWVFDVGPQRDGGLWAILEVVVIIKW